MGAKDAGKMLGFGEAVGDFDGKGIEGTERGPLRPGNGRSSGFDSEDGFLMGDFSADLLDGLGIKDGPSSRSGFFKSKGGRVGFACLLGSGGLKSSGS